MKKKLLIATLLLSVLLGGCGNSGDSSPAVIDNTNTWEDDTEYEETDTDYEEDTYEEPEEVVLETYPFTKLRPFSEERAWVNFNKDGNVYTGIIDTNGKLLYQAAGEFFYVSSFDGGTAFYRETPEETSPCGIIDLDGNVLFDSQITPDGGYLILGYGEGHFFAVQHIQNFDTNEWRYGTIDKYGVTLNEMQPDTDGVITNRYTSWPAWIGQEEYCSVIKYIGEDNIAFPVGLYNVSTAHFSSFFPAEDSYKYKSAIAIGDFQDGYTIVTIDKVAAGFHSFGITKDYQGPQDAIEIDDSVHIGYYSLYSEGLVWVSSSTWHSIEAGYYDKDWRCIVPMEQYDDDDDTILGRPFKGGYAGVTMKGADGERYATIVDKSGNLAYDPIKIDDLADFNSSSNGYFEVIIDGEKKIIGLDGAIYTLGVDDLSMLEGLSFGSVSEGFIIMGSEGDDSDITPYYVSLDTNVIIDSVKVTSADTDVIEDGSWSDETSENSSYIIPDSYDITGKWKSVGESGFGQAQPGAIVVFDGNNCNFYSPNDTYAFYKEDDRYVLDITSVLGESLSQSVNIIDDNNIKIAGASLRRIEE